MKIWFATTAHAGPEVASKDFDELDVVALREPLALGGKETLPTGAEGTMVGVWGGGKAFEVEFTEPTAALVTLRPSQIRRVPGE